MKKSLIISAFTAGMMMFCACSNNDTPVNNDDGLEVKQQLVLQVANTGDGLRTRAGRPLLSSEAKQSIENVKVIICNGENSVVYMHSISDWNNDSKPYTTNGHGREITIEIPKNEKLAVGTYTVYAIGYSSDSDYDLEAITSVNKENKFNANTVLSFKKEAKNKVGEEIFAGSLSLSVESGKGFKTPVVLNRQVAGAFAYVKDIPYIENAAKLQLVASRRNAQLVLGQFGNFDLTGNGTGNDDHINYVVNGTTAANDNNVIYSIALTDWFATVKDDDENGLIDAGENWEGDTEKYAQGSIFGGNFVIPFAKVDETETFKLQLTKENGTSVLREWIVKLPSSDKQLSDHDLWTWNSAFSFAKAMDTADKYSVVRNHLYGIGKRTLDKPTNPGIDPDEPETLNTKQELVLRVNDNWEVIHNMEIE